MTDAWVDRLLKREGMTGEGLAETAAPYTSFEDFFESELPGMQEQRAHVPGKDNRYTVTAFLDGDPLNCVGTAIVAGIVGTQRYELDFEVVTELAMDDRAENPWSTVEYEDPVHDHVFLKDSYGRIFGGALGLPAHQTENLPVEYLDGLHTASAIEDRRAVGNDDAAEDLYAELRENGFTDSRYINRKLHSPGA